VARAKALARARLTGSSRTNRAHQVDTVHPDAGNAAPPA